MLLVVLNNKLKFCPSGDTAAELPACHLDFSPFICLHMCKIMILSPALPL